MKVRNVIDELHLDVISNYDIGIYQLETGEYLVFHYKDIPKVVEFEDPKEFAEHIINFINEFGSKNPEVAVDNQEFKFIYKISKLLVNK